MLLSGRMRTLEGVCVKSHTPVQTELYMEQQCWSLNCQHNCVSLNHILLRPFIGHKICAWPLACQQRTCAFSREQTAGALSGKYTVYVIYLASLHQTLNLFILTVKEQYCSKAQSNDCSNRIHSTRKIISLIRFTFERDQLLLCIPYY